jgi:hypothetical protein
LFTKNSEDYNMVRRVAVEARGARLAGAKMNNAPSNELGAVLLFAQVAPKYRETGDFPAPSRIAST